MDLIDIVLARGGDSGGGGGGGSDVFVVTYTWDGTGTTLSCDKTFAEIDAAKTAGKLLVATLDGKTTTLTEYYVGEELDVSFLTATVYGLRGDVVFHLSDDTIETSWFEIDAGG